jgi:hypothetical protein
MSTAMAQSPPNLSRSRLALRAGPPAVCVLVGAVLVLAADDEVAIIGAGLIGVAVVLVLSNLFFEIGRSEDRARAREAERRRRRP